MSSYRRSRVVYVNDVTSLYPYLGNIERVATGKLHKLYVIVLSTVVFISYTEFLDSTKLTGNDGTITIK